MLHISLFPHIPTTSYAFLASPDMFNVKNREAFLLLIYMLTFLGCFVSNRELPNMSNHDHESERSDKNVTKSKRAMKSS